MSRKTETFPDIDLGAAGVTASSDPAPEFLSGGFNSAAWRVGNQVVKITKGVKDQAHTHKLLETMRHEHDVLEKHIGEYMPATEYSIVEDTNSGGAHVMSVQPFVPGASLEYFLTDKDNPTDPLREFLESCRQVYRKSRLMPDIANVQTAFNVLRTPNILISDEEAKPILVDTTFGKTQRSKVFGPAWTRAIYFGAVIAQKRLSLEAPR